MHHSLSIQDRSFNGRFPSFQQPCVQGYFCLDANRSYCADMRNLKYVHILADLKRVHFDLNYKCNEAIKKEDVDEKIDNILKWILQNEELQLNKTDSTFADIVCYRGLLNQLMCTPYERQDGWIILATKWKGVTYLCAKETEEEHRRRQEATEQQKRFMSWGYKFEQYMTTDKPGVKPNVEEPVCEKEEFCVMFKTKLNSHKLSYGAEMDGVNSMTEIKDMEELKSADFIELKTSRMMQHARQHQNFIRYKLIKWWGQSFLVGINQLLCGFRDDYGIVHQVEDFKVSDLSKKAKGTWDPALCMHFCDRFLTFVKTTVQEEQPDTVWKFEWEPRNDVTATKIPGPSEFSFLHQWFTNPTSQQQ